MDTTISLALCIIFTYALIGILVIHVYDLRKESVIQRAEIENLKKLVKPPPTNSGAWYPDPGNPPQPGFWVTQPSQAELPPLPPEIANFIPNASLGGQTSPLDNNLPLRGTAK